MIPCLFCGKDASSSKSKEHILPESMGNKTLYLEKGVVCDKCNNYFSVKIERPLLQKDYFKMARFYQFCGNKKGKVPETKVLIGDKFYDTINNNPKKERAFSINIPAEEMLKVVKNNKLHVLIESVNFPLDNNDYLMSRFIAKIAVEKHAFNSIKRYNMEHDVKAVSVSLGKEFEPIIKFARYGNLYNKPWNYTVEKKRDFRLFNDNFIASMDFEETENNITFIFNLYNCEYRMLIAGDPDC